MNLDTKQDLETEQQQRDRVLIAAAVAVLFGQSAAIRHIRAMPGHGQGAWLREGRLEVESSHRMATPLIRLDPDRGVGNV